jgi:large subunit ribosomal protein L25
VPEQIEVNVSALNVGDAIHASEITLPKGAELVTPGSEVVVQVAAPSGGAGDDEEGEAGAEPEVISKGKDEEEGE